MKNRVGHRLCRLLVAAAIVFTGLAGAQAALACGTGGYSYAGMASPGRAFGIGATVTPMGGFSLVAGHVAGWVGVGGPGLGPAGTDEWLQVGFNRIPQLAGNSLYYELALPNRLPTYHQIATRLPMGRPVRFAVLEMHNRPSWWRVWVNGRAASRPIYMPGSHGRWAPIATAESYDGGTSGACNGFLYSFRNVSIANVPGGGWRQLASGYPITSSSTQVERDGRVAASFIAAEGRGNALPVFDTFRP